MVRLKLLRSSDHKSRWLQSQFHYGSIKTNLEKYIINKIQEGLNSTMVRLKPHFAKRLISGLDRSQFHYGSIKTKIKSEKDFLMYQSQFHYGSIKTDQEGNLADVTVLSQFHYGSIKTCQKSDLLLN